MQIRFYVNGIDFKDLPVTQNEQGWYYLFPNGTYWKPVLKYFDSATGKPSEVVKKVDGSHVAYKAEHPIDFSVAAGSKITASREIKFNNYLYSKAKKKCGIELVVGNSHQIFYHVKTDRQEGTMIPAGEVIGIVMTQTENEASGVGPVAPHVHGGNLQLPGYDPTTFRELVLAPEAIVTPLNLITGTVFKTSENNMRLRNAASLSSPVLFTIPQWSFGTVKNSDPKNIIADGYEWASVSIDSNAQKKEGWLAVKDMVNDRSWVAIVSVPDNPQDQIEELKKQIVEKDKEIADLKAKLSEINKISSV